MQTPRAVDLLIEKPGLGSGCWILSPFEQQPRQAPRRPTRTICRPNSLYALHSSSSSTSQLRISTVHGTTTNSRTTFWMVPLPTFTGSRSCSNPPCTQSQEILRHDFGTYVDDPPAIAQGGKA